MFPSSHAAPATYSPLPTLAPSSTLHEPRCSPPEQGLKEHYYYYYYYYYYVAGGRALFTTHTPNYYQHL